MENWSLRVSASISLGLHLLLIFTASILFSDMKVHQPAIRHVKVTLLTLEKEKKSIPKSVSPLSVKNPMEGPEKRLFIQEQKEKEPDPKKEKEFEPPIPLPVRSVSKDIPVEEPKVILLPREEEEVVNPVRNASVALNPTGIILKSNPSAEQWGIISNGVKEPANRVADAALEKGVSQGSNISDTPSGEGGGIGQGGFPAGGSKKGLGAGRGDFHWRVSGEGTGVGQGGSSGGGSGNGSGPGTGSGQGDPRGGSSRKGTGALGKLFPSAKGVAGGYPRYAENPKPPYPEEARRKGMEGEVVLRVEVLANGWVGQIEVKCSSGHEILDRTALSTVKQWKFIPAHKENGSIPFWVNIPIKFQLQ